MESTVKDNLYETSDIALAAFLYCSGVKLIGIDRQDPRRCNFCFDVPDAELIKLWQEGKATVNPLGYHHAYQELKFRVFRGDR